MGKKLHTSKMEFLDSMVRRTVEEIEIHHPDSSMYADLITEAIPFVGYSQHVPESVEKLEQAVDYGKGLSGKS